jgi:transcription initiation factor TFIID TATA-box-binding protein
VSRHHPQPLPKSGGGLQQRRSQDSPYLHQWLETHEYSAVSINLNAIAIGLGLENVEYEPEQFPGLVYRLGEPNVVVLLFGSGKMVITGGKQPEDVEAATEELVSQLTDLDLLR